ncbi:regulator of microtubule dynamics protein 1-like [Dysidea avara]|uniref:regulator of microtubule dynamics protein 1-like n=1 Tax=Dysidea avara TaxID=196820 RepID=UPI003324B736
MEGSKIPWLAFCAGVGTGYTLGVVTYRWLRLQGESRLSTSLANSVQALTTEVSRLRQTLSEAGTQLLQARRTSVTSRRTENAAKREAAGESEREEDDDEYFEAQSEESQEEKLELSSGSEQLAEFLKEADVLLHEAISNEEKCGTVLIELRQKVKEYPNHEGVLWRAGTICHHQSAFHKQHSNTELELELLQEGVQYTQQALDVNESCWQAHKWFAILTGATVLHKGIQERIAGGFEFKEHIDRAIQLKADEPNSYHLLGRWQFEVAGLSWLERKAASALFASPPSSTYEEALDSFNKAEELKPKGWKSNLLWIAKCHLKLQAQDVAVEWLIKAWHLENSTPEDHEVTTELQKLLSQFSPDTLS